jgi:hypothetical protein
MARDTRRKTLQERVDAARNSTIYSEVDKFTQNEDVREALLELWHKIQPVTFKPTLFSGDMPKKALTITNPLLESKLIERPTYTGVPEFVGGWCLDLGQVFHGIHWYREKYVVLYDPYVTHDKPYSGRMILLGDPKNTSAHYTILENDSATRYNNWTFKIKDNTLMSFLVNFALMIEKTEPNPREVGRDYMSIPGNINWYRKELGW